MPLSGPVRRARRGLALLVCLAVPLSACTSGGADDPEGPEAVAALLAERLTEHTLTGVPVVDTSGVDAFAELVGPLDERPVEVGVAGVDETDGAATARLEWSWDLTGTDDGTWTYATEVGLVEVGGDWVVEWSPAALEPSLTDADRLGLFTVPGARGRVTGDGGEPIVVDRRVQRYGLDKTRIVPAQVVPSARAIARTVGVDVAPYVAEARQAGDAAFVEAIVLRPEDAREQLRADEYNRIPGAVAIADELPLAPTRDFAAPVLGRVGPATAELVEESDGRIEPGDEVGLSGLQLRYDEQLAPTDGVEVVAARGGEEGDDGEEGEDTPEERRTLHTVEAVDGDDLATTLDVDLQRAAEDVLAPVTGSASAIVALRPSDGAVLAAASGPGGEGLSTATEGRFAPGSTFKVVTSLALLRAGLGPDSPLDCPATTTVDGRVFGNYDDYPAGGTGRIDLRTALANSCNTAFIGARSDLGGTALSDAAAALGLGVDAEVGFASYFGEVPPPDGETDEAASTIGQGRVLASPLAMAAVAASVAAGSTVVPSLLPDVEAEATAPEVPLTGAEARTLRSLMRSVVTDGSASFLADLPGEVGAKTGTAEYGEPGTDGAPAGELPTHAWMIATRGDLAVAVLVETGDSGSATAGPLLEDLLRAAPPTR